MPPLDLPLSHPLSLRLRGFLGFPGDSVVKNPPANAGDTGLISGLGRPHGEGNGNPLQYSCLEILRDRGARGRRRDGHDLAMEQQQGFS